MAIPVTLTHQNCGPDNGCGVNICVKLNSGGLGGNNNNFAITEADDWLMVLSASHKYPGQVNNNLVGQGNLADR